MPQQILVEEDTQPVLSDTLDTAKDPTGGSVELIVQKGGSTELIVSDTGNITDATKGNTGVEYQFNATQTANLGTHKFEWVVTYSDGDKESFPKDGHDTVEFDAQLNRGGTPVDPDISKRLGAYDVLLLNELASAPSEPAVDDWGVYKAPEDGGLDLLDQNGTTYTLPQRTVEKTADYTANATETVLCDHSAGAFNVTLPPPSPVVEATVKKVDASANATTIVPNGGDSPGGQTIDGLQNMTISTQYASRTIVANSTDYFIK